MLEPPVFRPPGPALVRVEQGAGEGDSLAEVGAGGVVAMGLLNTVLMLATLATLGRSAGFSYPPHLASILFHHRLLHESKRSL